jgi:hypothetical protein
VKFLRRFPARTPSPKPLCDISAPKSRPQFASPKMLRIFPFGLSNRRKQPERYAKYRPTFLQNIIKYIDKNKVKKYTQ